MPRPVAGKSKTRSKDDDAELLAEIDAKLKQLGQEKPSTSVKPAESAAADKANP